MDSLLRQGVNRESLDLTEVCGEMVRESAVYILICAGCSCIVESPQLHYKREKHL
jgi:hypothetical protein